MNNNEFELEVTLRGDIQNFYNSEKEYFLKKSLLNQYEMILYKILEEKLDKKYITLPQINLQSIIETNSNKRNNELYRNLDFVIFYRDSLKPILAIELNGLLHEEDKYVKLRDESIKKILDSAKLKLVTITSEELRTLNIIEIFSKIIRKLKE